MKIANIVPKRVAMHKAGDAVYNAFQPMVERAITQAMAGYPSNLKGFLTVDVDGGYTQAKRALTNYVKAGTNLVLNAETLEFTAPEGKEPLWKVDEFTEIGMWWDKTYRAPEKGQAKQVPFTDEVYAKDLRAYIVKLGKKAKDGKNAKAKAMHREVLTALAGIIE